MTLNQSMKWNRKQVEIDFYLYQIHNQIVNVLVFCVTNDFFVVIIKNCNRKIWADVSNGVSQSIRSRLETISQNTCIYIVNFVIVFSFSIIITSQIYAYQISQMLTFILTFDARYCKSLWFLHTFFPIFLSYCYLILVLWNDFCLLCTYIHSVGRMREKKY